MIGRKKGATGKNMRGKNVLDTAENGLVIKLLRRYPTALKFSYYSNSNQMQIFISTKQRITNEPISLL